MRTALAPKSISELQRDAEAEPVAKMANTIEIGLPTEEYMRKLQKMIFQMCSFSRKARLGRGRWGWGSTADDRLANWAVMPCDLKALNSISAYRGPDLVPQIDLETPVAEARLDELERLNAELHTKVRFLEMQLQADRPYAQLYKLGAGSLFVAVISLVFWGLTGIGAPFHPIFALAAVPVSVGLIGMAFLVRGAKGHGSARDATKHE